MRIESGPLLLPPVRVGSRRSCSRSPDRLCGGRRSRRACRSTRPTRTTHSWARRTAEARTAGTATGPTRPARTAHPRARRTKTRTRRAKTRTSARGARPTRSRPRIRTRSAHGRPSLTPEGRRTAGPASKARATGPTRTHRSRSRRRRTRTAEGGRARRTGTAENWPTGARRHGDADALRRGYRASRWNWRGAGRSRPRSNRSRLPNGWPHLRGLDRSRGRRRRVSRRWSWCGDRGRRLLAHGAEPLRNLPGQGILDDAHVVLGIHAQPLQ